MMRVAGLIGKRGITIEAMRMCSYFSASKVVYKPLIPMKENFNTLYVKESYSKCKAYKFTANYLLYLPGFGMMVNNFLTQWSFINSFCFFGLMTAGYFGSFILKSIQGWEILCIQVDPEVEYFYFTIAHTLSNLPLRKDNGASKGEIRELVKNYHPAGKSLDLNKVESEIRSILKNEKKTRDPLYYTYIDIENKINRIKIPIRQVSLQLRLEASKFPELERDKERLSSGELIKKYENAELIAVLPYPNQKVMGKIEENNGDKVNPIESSGLLEKKKDQIHLRILGDENVHKRYHDYLIALALGFKIDTSGNAQRVTIEEQEENTEDTDDDNVEEKIKGKPEKEEKN